jgi:hypothetical protein
MEEVLNLYQQPYNEGHPVVCMDEASRQLIAETRQPLPLQPGRERRYDYEYRRCGVSNLFMFFEPLAAWRHVEVRRRRTMVDWAHCIRILLDDYYPDARRVHLVMDNLNTHRGASLYETFKPAEARRLLDRLVFHYTPKHGSWLNMAEIELSALSRQCLANRIDQMSVMQDRVAKWEEARNKLQATAYWQFKTTGARIKLRSLYPSINT